MGLLSVGGFYLSLIILDHGAVVVPGLRTDIAKDVDHSSQRDPPAGIIREIIDKSNKWETAIRGLLMI